MDLEKLLSTRRYDGKKIISDLIVLTIISCVLGIIAWGIRSLSFFTSLQWIPDIIWTSIFVIALIVLFAFIKPLLNNLFHWLCSVWPWTRLRDFDFIPQANLKNLIFQGIAKKINNSLYLTNSRAGALIKDLQWKNFIATFAFKFGNLETNLKGISIESLKPNRFNYVGFIFRAQSLEDYFMLSIGIEIMQTDLDKEADQNLLTPLITPHIRLNGRWEVFGGHGLSTSIKVNSFNKVKIVVKDNNVVLDINNQTFEWVLPTNFEKGSVDINKDSREKFGDGTKIPFYNQYGMIGFRAADAEHVVIKDINIKKV